VAQYGADCALVSTAWNWGQYYVKAVQQVLDGTWNNTPYWGGMEDDGIILSSFHKSVPAEVKDKVLAEQAKLAKGEDTIFAGPLMDQAGKTLWKEGEQASDQDLLTMRVLVKGVSGKIPQ
jgi:basic membrane lipoprotein Med (substrate-binding protein (PBP1-ABC) superfamily)